MSRFYWHKGDNWSHFSTWLVHRLPKRLVYFCAIRVWGYATYGYYGSTDPTSITMDECLKRWDYDMDRNEYRKLPNTP